MNANALFRIYIGKGRYIAVFSDISVVLEYYDKNGDMSGAKWLIK